MPIDQLLIFYLRQARRRARDCAAAEALCLLEDLGAGCPRGGPLSEKGGLFWITVNAEDVEEARARLPRLGYTCAVDLLHPVEARRRAGRRREDPELVHWKGQSYTLVRIYEEDADLLRESAPDRRLFALEAEAGGERLIRGYRGDGGALSRRGLAVCDARLLVNLVRQKGKMVFLDPFAGAGGIIQEAVSCGYHVYSSDIEPMLRPGLERMGAIHSVADACHLPFPTGSVDMIAAEPPFHPAANPLLEESLAEMRRVLTEGGKLALLCAAHQAEGLRQKALDLGFVPWLDSPLDRKGMECVILAWINASGESSR